MNMKMKTHRNRPQDGWTRDGAWWVSPGLPWCPLGARVKLGDDVTSEAVE
jgi:hypothetical protein